MDQKYQTLLVYETYLALWVYNTVITTCDELDVIQCYPFNESNTIKQMTDYL